MKSYLHRFLLVLFCGILLSGMALVACAPDEPSTPSEDNTPDPAPEEKPSTENENNSTEKPEAPEETALINRFDLSTAQPGWLNFEGKASPDAAFYTGDMIPVEVGDEVYFGSAVTTQGWHLVAYDENEQGLFNVTIHTGIVTVDALYGDSAIMKYVIPDDVAFIRPVCDKRYASCYLLTINQPYVADDFFAFFDLKPVAKPTLSNCFDAATAQIGWVNCRGESSPDGTFSTCGMIPVEAGDEVYFGSAVTTQGWHAIAYDENENGLFNITIHNGLVLLDRLYEDSAIMKYVVPDDVAYIRMVCDNRYQDRYLVTVNAPFDADDFYDFFDLEAPSAGPEIEADGSSPLYGKKVLFCGDSISYGHHDIPAGYSWAGRIQKYYGTESDNRSRSGWCLSTVRGAGGQIVNQLKEVKNRDYDMIVVQGGVNDAWGTTDGTNKIAPVGEMTDSFDVKDFDTTTYAGGLEEFFYYAREYYPDATLCYIISFYMPNAGVGHVGDMEEYYAMGMEICDKWDVPYLDLYHDEYVTNELLEVGTAKCLRDPVHPNSVGYDRLSPYIGDWLETLVD